MDTSAVIGILVSLKDNFTQGFEGVANKLKANSAQIRNAGLAVSAVGATLAYTIHGWVAEANEGARNEQVLNQVLASTKGVAGMTADAVKNLADELAKNTTIQDDAILSAENVLLRFTKIGKDVFPDVTKTVLDMATAMNSGATPSAGQLEQVAMQLGKALNDPADALASLTRLGVRFSDDQKKVIEAMVKTGDVAGAQKAIMDRLAVSYGGSAAAATQTLQGKMEQIGNTFSKFKQDLGTALLPILGKLADAFVWLAQKVGDLPQGWKTFIAIAALVVAGLASIAGPILLLTAAIPSLIAGATALGGAFTFMLGPVGLIIAAITALAVAGYFIVTNWDTIKAAASNIWGAISTYLSGVINGIADFFRSVFTSISNVIMTIWDGIQTFFGAIWGAIKAVIDFHIALILGIIEIFLEAVGTNITEVWNGIKTFFSVVWDGIKSIISTALGAISDVVTTTWDAITVVWETVWGGISTFFADIWEGIKNVLSLGLNFLGSLINTAIKPIVAAFTAMWNMVSNVITGAIEGIKTIVKGMINWILDKLNWIIEQINWVMKKAEVLPGVTAPQIPKIPLLANGGIVTKPTLAMIGEAGPEAVIPLSGGRGAGMGTTIIIQDNTLLDEDAGIKIGNQIVRQLGLNASF